MSDMEISGHQRNPRFTRPQVFDLNILEWNLFERGTEIRFSSIFQRSCLNRASDSSAITRIIQANDEKVFFKYLIPTIFGVLSPEIIIKI